MKTIDWSAISGQFVYTYTLNGQYAAITMPNGQHRDYTYDDQGRLKSVANVHPTAGNLAVFEYGYDLNHDTGQYTMLGQRTSKTIPGIPPLQFDFTTLYYYDSNYQLTRADYPKTMFQFEVHQWTYDAIGNRLTNMVDSTTENYTYVLNGLGNNTQRLKTTATSTYTYDNNGSITSDGSYTYTWHTKNAMLSTITRTSPAFNASYKYNYLGKRTSRTVNGATTTYIYDGQNLIAERGANAADYLFGPGIDEPLAQKRGSAISYYSVDGLGSVVLTNDPAGNIENTYTTDAWGVIRAQTGATPNPFGYTAREFGEAGLMYYRARYYNPNIGRFVSEDPRDLTNPMFGGFHHYAYVMNTPLMGYDPYGLQFADSGSRFEVDGGCECAAGGAGGAPPGGPPLKEILVKETTEACQTKLAGITNPWLKSCISFSCSFGYIKCKYDCSPGIAGLGIPPEIRGITATFCVNTWKEYPGGRGYPPGSVGDVVIHEWAHGCGWKDCGGQGVPDNHRKRSRCLGNIFVGGLK